MFLFIFLVTRDNGMSHPKEAVEFWLEYLSFLKTHAVTTHGHAKVTEIGNAPGLVCTRPQKSTQPSGLDILLVVNDRQYSNTH
jgi:hypothetical protein